MDECKPLPGGRRGGARAAAARGGAAPQGGAVQVEPIKPMLKPPGTRRLTLKSVELLSTFAFNSTCAATPRTTASSREGCPYAWETLWWMMSYTTRGSVWLLTTWCAARGRAVQVDPMRPTLKAPGTERLKLQYEKPLSNFPFKFNLRRYRVGRRAAQRRVLAGAYTRPLFGST